MLRIVVDVPTEAVDDAFKALFKADVITGHRALDAGDTTRLRAVVRASDFDQAFSELIAIDGAEIVEADVAEDLEVVAAA